MKEYMHFFIELFYKKISKYEESNIGKNIFEYNTLNQQVKVTTKNNETLISRYDTDGLRYEIEENETLSRFIFNKNGDILVETDKEDNVISRFTRGYDIVSANVEDKKYYYNVDEQGSTSLITDKYGKISDKNFIKEARLKYFRRVSSTSQIINLECHLMPLVIY